jgi:AcrR family transcriptional regulator
MASTARPRTRRPEVRPDQILDAAERLLVAEGGAAMTMDGVAAAADVGKGTIYHYFGSKAELLSALRNRYLAGAVARAQQAAEPLGGTVMDRVERFVDVLLESIEANGQLIWILFHETAVEEDDELAAVYEPLLALVTEGAENGEFQISDPAFTTGFILHGLHGTVEAAFHNGAVDPGHLKSGLRSAIRAILR